MFPAQIPLDVKTKIAPVDIGGTGRLKSQLSRILIKTFHPALIGGGKRRIFFWGNGGIQILHVNDKAGADRWNIMTV